MKQMMMRNRRQGAAIAVEHNRQDEIDRFVAAVSVEYHQGLSATRTSGPAVTVFGSARTKPGHPDYTHAVTTGRTLAMAGYTVVTGGGSGIMEAANRGAALGGGHSIGLRIELPFEEAPNAFVATSVTFDHFPARKTCLIVSCDAVVVYPGGFGTMDELFEVLTLIQTRKIPALPVVLVGAAFWSGMLDWFGRDVQARGCIGAPDLALVTVVESPAEVLSAIKGERFGVSVAQRAAQPA
ncbi:MAG: TIGR00730 family Rossman fold protein [Actinomycetes bacterium]